MVRRLLLGLVLLAGAGYLAAYLLTGDRVPRGTVVAGVAIGGLRAPAARELLAATLEPRLRRPVAANANGTPVTLVPAESGFGFDVAASVAATGVGKSWDPRRMWGYVVGGRDLPPVVRVNSVVRDQVVARLASRVAVPARDGQVGFRDGEAWSRPPRNGVALDRSGTAEALRAAVAAGRSSVELPVRVVRPAVDAEQVSVALEKVANPAMAAPVVLRLGGATVQLRPSQYAAALTMAPHDGRLVLQVDRHRLVAMVRRGLSGTSVALQDATVALVAGRPRVVPARPGLTLDPQQLVAEFPALVVAPDERRVLELRGVVSEPRVSTADAQSWGVREKVSEFTTHFPYAGYRNINLARAAELVDGTLLLPGDTFSLNQVVGERTPENGFTKGFIISDGVYRVDYGGGVSQVATTLFNAAFFAGLKDVEHTPHSFYIDRYPAGREATVAWPSLDLRFTNTTPYGVLVHAWVDRSTPSKDGAVHVELWSTKYWDIKAGSSGRYRPTEPRTRHLGGPGCVPHRGYGGFDIDVYRDFYRVGSSQLDHRETMHTRYTPSDTVVCS